MAKDITHLDTPCLEWPMYRNAEGYGVKSVGGRLQLAHRWAWEQWYGPVPASLFVLHRCDNPPCINPDHLFLGTLGDNYVDMVAKGRRRFSTGERQVMPKCGHTYDRINSLGYRVCGQCSDESTRLSKQRHRAQRTAYQREWRTRQKRRKEESPT